MKKRKRAPGAGRPPLPESERRKPKQMKFPPDILEYLKSTGEATATVEQAVRRSIGFRKWLSAKNISPKIPKTTN